MELEKDNFGTIKTVEKFAIAKLKTILKIDFTRIVEKIYGTATNSDTTSIEITVKTIFTIFSNFL